MLWAGAIVLLFFCALGSQVLAAPAPSGQPSKAFQLDQIPPDHAAFAGFFLLLSVRPCHCQPSQCLVCWVSAKGESRGVRGVQVGLLGNKMSFHSSYSCLHRPCLRRPAWIALT